jgi:NAD(P)-dependent dehydrogenase (short-subunit alcohol dehydrogenase family)
MAAELPLQGRHAVITGSGSGIGAAIAAALADQGAAVTLMGRTLETLQRTADVLPLHSAARCVRCDVTDPDSVAAAFEFATGRQPVDILINNAGAAPTAPFHKLNLDAWRSVMNLNLDGVFLCISQVIGTMRERRAGRIVNIASTAALRGYRYVSAYSAAKHAVLGLTRSLALETAQLGITVNAICPGYTDTDIVRNGVAAIMQKTGRSEAEALAEFTRTNPQGRLIDVDEIAAAALWLCSDAARSVTGQALSISGGEVM